MSLHVVCNYFSWHHVIIKVCEYAKNACDVEYESGYGNILVSDKLNSKYQ